MCCCRECFLLSLQWLLSLSPHLSSPHPRVQKGLGTCGGWCEGQKGVLEHNQTPVSLVATPNLVVSTYLNCSTKRVDEQSYACQAALGGRIAPRGAAVQ